MKAMLVFALLNYIVFIIANTESVSVTSDTVIDLKKNGRNNENVIEDVQQLSEFQNRPEDNNKDVQKNTDGRRSKGVKLEFTEFIDGIVQVLKNFANLDLEGVMSYINKELTDITCSDCEIPEILENKNFRITIIKALDKMKRAPAYEIKNSLSMFLKGMDKMRTNDAGLDLLDYLDYLYKDIDQTKLTQVLHNLQDYKAKSERSLVDLETTIRQGYKMIFLDHYKGLKPILKRRLKNKIEKLFFGKVEPGARRYSKLVHDTDSTATIQTHQLIEMKSTGKNLDDIEETPDTKGVLLKTGNQSNEINFKIVKRKNIKELREKYLVNNKDLTKGKYGSDYNNDNKNKKQRRPYKTKYSSEVIKRKKMNNDDSIDTKESNIKSRCTQHLKIRKKLFLESSDTESQENSKDIKERKRITNVETSDLEDSKIKVTTKIIRRNKFRTLRNEKQLADKAQSWKRFGYFKSMVNNGHIIHNKKKNFKENTKEAYGSEKSSRNGEDTVSEFARYNHKGKKNLNMEVNEDSEEHPQNNIYIEHQKKRKTKDMSWQSTIKMSLGNHVRRRHQHTIKKQKTSSKKIYHHLVSSGSPERVKAMLEEKLYFRGHDYEEYEPKKRTKTTTKRTKKITVPIGLENYDENFQTQVNLRTTRRRKRIPGQTTKMIGRRHNDNDTFVQTLPMSKNLSTVTINHEYDKRIHDLEKELAEVRSQIEFISTTATSNISIDENDNKEIDHIHAFENTVSPKVSSTGSVDIKDDFVMKENVYTNALEYAKVSNELTSTASVEVNRDIINRETEVIYTPEGLELIELILAVNKLTTVASTSMYTKEIPTTTVTPIISNPTTITKTQLLTSILNIDNKTQSNNVDNLEFRALESSKEDSSNIIYNYTAMYIKSTAGSDNLKLSESLTTQTIRADKTTVNNKTTTRTVKTISDVKKISYSTATTESDTKLKVPKFNDTTTVKIEEILLKSNGSYRRSDLLVDDESLQEFMYHQLGVLNKEIQ